MIYYLLRGDKEMKIKGTTKSRGNKHELDKFYTKPDVANKLIGMLNFRDYDVIIEPSAGGGSFSNILQDKYGDKVFAYDLEPESTKIIKQDWFTLDKGVFNGKSVIVIGNPPFGNNGSLALKFIKESSFADTIAFILPKGFKKVSMKNKIPLNFWLDYEVDLDSSIFELDGEDYSVPCVFQVWVKKDIDREKVIYDLKSNYINFCKKEDADFRVQRVGGNAGKAYLNKDVSISSNYFIKNNSEFSVEELINIINSLEYLSINDTTGPRSISKGEFLKVLHESLDKRH